MLKVTGLVLLLVSVSQLPGYFQLTSRGYEFSLGDTLTAAALGLGPLAVLGLVLWFFPGTLVNKIVTPGPADPAPLDTRPLELVAITVVGVYLVADGLISAVRSGVLLIFLQRQDEVTVIPASVFANIGATVAELVIGATLCIGAKGVARAVERLRRES